MENPAALFPQVQAVLQFFNAALDLAQGNQRKRAMDHDVADARTEPVFLRKVHGFLARIEARLIFF